MGAAIEAVKYLFRAAHVCMYVCCSDGVGVCGDVCCVAAVDTDSAFLALEC